MRTWLCMGDNFINNKTAKLKVQNLAQATFRFSLKSFHAPHWALNSCWPETNALAYRAKLTIIDLAFNSPTTCPIIYRASDVLAPVAQQDVEDVVLGSGAESRLVHGPGEQLRVPYDDVGVVDTEFLVARVWLALRHLASKLKDFLRRHWRTTNDNPKVVLAEFATLSYAVLLNA